MLSKPDIHWIENIQGPFNKVVCSHSLPAVYLAHNPLREGMILTSNKSFFSTTGTVFKHRFFGV